MPGTNVYMYIIKYTTKIIIQLNINVQIYNRVQYLGNVHNAWFI